MSNININVSASEAVRLRIAVSRQRQECADRSFSMMMTRLECMKNLSWTDEQQAEWEFWYDEENRQEEKWRTLVEVINTSIRQNKRFANDSNPFIKE